MVFPTSDEACPHSWDESAMRRPGLHTVVHRDECAYCCRTCLHTGGVYVCMCCYAGLCEDHLAKHTALNPTHAMYTRIKEMPAEKEPEVHDVNQVGVVVAKEYTSAVCCAACMVEFVSPPELAMDSYSGIMNAPVPGVASSTADAGTAAYQKPQCPHLVCLEQLPSPFTAGPPTSDDVCSVEGCGCKVNNWMCVTCGAIGCPRAEAGGHGHALQHHELTGHSTCVKLGTITPEGADYYCYACDDDVSDVHFASHMAHFSIDIHTAKKTAKTMSELEYDYSSQFDFNKITEAGTTLVPAFGPGHTGIRNIGNSCYIASVVQCLLSLKVFQDAFYPHASTPHQAACVADPYQCRACQTERIAAGLLSGEFSREGAVAEENGVCPRLFKNVYAQKHVEFSTGAQQDAQEYLLYLVEEMRRHVRVPEATPFPTDVFEMVTEQRVQCQQCHRVRYSQVKESCLSLPIPVSVDTPVPKTHPDGTPLTEAEMEAARPRCSLDDCLVAAITPTACECRCEACGKATEYETTTRLASFPDVLPVYLRRVYFDVQTLTTKKLDVYVDVPEEVDLEAFKSAGLQEGEEVMPDTASGPRKAATTAVEVDEVALVTVMSMGIETEVARYALQQTSMNVERAVDYIFSHPEIEQEMAAAQHGSGAGDTAASSAAQAKVKPATDGCGKYQLVAMISHMGASAKTGHYVCHMKDTVSGRWLLFNDEKVGESQQPPFSMASIYFFKRVE